MNKDQVKGVAKDVAGKVQEQAGSWLEAGNNKSRDLQNRFPARCKRPSVTSSSLLKISKRALDL